MVEVRGFYGRGFILDIWLKLVKFLVLLKELFSKGFKVLKGFVSSINRGRVIGFFWDTFFGVKG